MHLQVEVHLPSGTQLDKSYTLSVRVVRPSTAPHQLSRLLLLNRLLVVPLNH
jgi:hypothetical protein